MPTPIAHVFAGIATAGGVAGRWRMGASLVIAVAVLSILPDFDFLAGFLVGAPHRFHRGPTHSLVGITLMSLVVAPVLSRIASRDRDSGRSRTRMAWVIALAVLLSHLFTDAIMPDPGGGVGVPLLWPFTSRQFAAPLPVPVALANALEIRFDGPTSFFLDTMFSARTMLVFVLEGLLFAPLLLVPLVLRRVRGPSEARAHGVPDDQGKMPRSR